MKFHSIINISLCFVMCFAAGCSKSAESSNTGVFIDSPVSGLEYVIDGRQGVTVDGYFEFFEGETISFYVGGIPIGYPVVSKKILTPVDIGPPFNTFPDDPMVLNITRFLQSLDMDGVPSNGIDISSALREAISERGFTGIDFNQSAESFERDSSVLAILEIFTSLTPEWRPETVYTTGNIVAQAAGDKNSMSRTFKVLDTTGRSRSGENEPDWNNTDSEGRIVDHNITWIEMNRTLVSGEDALKHFLSSIANYKLSKIVFINLGDGFTGGAQSGTHLIHQYTQEKGYVQRIYNELKQVADVIWNGPLIDFDQLKKQTEPEADYNFIGTRLNITSMPYNLGVCGATVNTLLNEKSDENLLMHELYRYNDDMNSDSSDSVLGLSDPVTQMEAALYLASLYPDRQKVFTLWVGMNDIFSPLIEDYGTNLTASNIGEYTDILSYTRNLEILKNNLEKIINNLAIIDHSSIFIANIPPLSKQGFLFGKSDIEALIRINIPAENEYGGDHTGLKIIDSSIMEENEYIGFLPFADEIAPKLALEKDFDMTNIHQAISLVKTQDENFLSVSEATSISDHINRVNALLEEVSDSYKNVYIVDMNNYLENMDIRFSIPCGESGGEDEVIINTTWGGGFYSLDGYFPSDLGYISIADQFIFAMNNAQIGVRIENIDNDVLTEVWLSDPYNDQDRDFYTKGPEDNALIGSNYLKLADCDDDNNDIFAPATNLVPKGTCP